MSKGFYNVPVAVNEKVKEYAPGSPERTELLEEYKRMYNTTIDIPMYIGDKQVFTNDKRNLTPPHEHSHVIGNSNYDAGKLDNPVNDALLIAETLEKLDFDVILDTNISNQQAFKQTIFSFGEKRPNYNVAFVYYAGHGIQVGSQNCLLPTHHFELEFQNRKLRYQS